ncbi:MAG: hypothetical protein EYC69_11155 [Bacteroidetes bacterium]|nr:MAG: hypothetical protein EYC69_11155 [Bacteroidota bacterium]
MNPLNSIVNGLSKEEVRFFKLWLERGYDHDDRLDKSLFDYMRKSGDRYDEEKIFRKLYLKGSKNSFYRLRNRLLSELNKSLLIQHFDDDESNLTLHFLSLAKFFLRKNHDASHYYLKKSEALAIRTENFELLDIIYSDFIRLSHELISIDPEVYVLKRRSNQQNINQIRAIDDILAVLTYKMKITQNYSSTKNPILSLLQEIVNSYSHDNELSRSPKLRFQIYHAVTQILLQKRDYQALEEYLLVTYKDFVNEKLFSKSNHDMKLQMLVYLINSLFKNKKLKESLLYAEILKQAMTEHQSLLYDKYLFFYYNSLVINYSRLNRDKAIEILLEMKSNKKIRADLFHEMFVYLNLAVSYFDNKEFHLSIRHLNGLYLSEGYRKADASLRFKISVAELMIRFELNDFDVLEAKVRQLQKEYASFISDAINIRESLIIQAIKSLMQTTPLKKDGQLVSKIRKVLLNDEGTESGDAEILNYRTWLLGKGIR